MADTQSRYNKSKKGKARNIRYNSKRKAQMRKNEFNRKLRKYNLTHEEFQQMLLDQDHRCKICGQQTILVIDHCHTTGVVRGMLCRNCNTGLGMFEDCVETLRKAADYVAAGKELVTDE